MDRTSKTRIAPTALAAFTQRPLLKWPLLPVVATIALSLSAGIVQARGWLGVSVQDITAELTEAMALTVDHGALVSDIVPEGPADRAGLLTRDVILKLDERSVEDSSDLIRGLQGMEPDQKVKLALLRGDRELTKEVILGEAPGRTETGGRRELRSRAHRPKPLPPIPHPLSAQTGGMMLGVRIHPLDENLAPYFHVEAGAGVLVLGVEPESPAQKAGLLPGDVIVRFNEASLSDPEDLQRAVRRLGPGDDWSAEIFRQGRETKLRGRMERGWQSPATPGGVETYRFFDDQDREERGPVLERRQMRRLEREMDRLREKIEHLQEEIERIKDR